MKILLLQEMDCLLICGGGEAINSKTTLSDVVYSVCYKLGSFLRKTLNQRATVVTSEVAEDFCGPVYPGPVTA